MKPVRRFDIAAVSKAEKTQQGFLRAPIRATRTGVFVYKKADGTIRSRELRLPEEVFSADSMASLSGVPITNEHPKDLVNAQNSKQLMVGYTAHDARKDEEKFLAITGTITDAQTIMDVEAGKQEVSCGYLCELEEAPGVFEGERYDVIQRNIRYNHIAVVQKGRAGREARVKLDADDAVMMSPEEINEPKGTRTMKKITLDGKEYDVSEEAHAAITAALVKKDSAVSEKQVALDSLQAKHDGLASDKARLENEAKAHKDSAVPAEKIREAAKARVALLKVAEQVLPEDTKLDDMDDLEIKKAVIKADDDKVDFEGKSEVYIEGRFDHVRAHLEGREDKSADLGKTIIKNRTDGSDSDSEKARKDSLQKSKDAWKKPLSVSREKVGA